MAGKNFLMVTFGPVAVWTFHGQWSSKNSTNRNLYELRRLAKMSRPHRADHRHIVRSKFKAWLGVIIKVGFQNSVLGDFRVDTSWTECDPPFCRQGILLDPRLKLFPVASEANSLTVYVLAGSLCSPKPMSALESFSDFWAVKVNSNFVEKRVKYLFEGFHQSLLLNAWRIGLGLSISITQSGNEIVNYWPLGWSMAKHVQKLALSIEIADNCGKVGCRACCACQCELGMGQLSIKTRACFCKKVESAMTSRNSHQEHDDFRVWCFYVGYLSSSCDKVHRYCANHFLRLSLNSLGVSNQVPDCYSYIISFNKSMADVFW